MLLVALGLVAAAVALIVVVATTGGSGGGNKADLSGVQTFGPLPRNHVQGRVQYAQTPPVGGDHSAIVQNCGFYAEPVPSEQAVHSMEHGAVWITYRPDLSVTQVDVLRRLAQGHDYVLVGPFPGLPSPVVASAWSVQLRLPSATDPRLSAFVRRYSEGPQAPERGALCSGGAGNPESG